MRSLLKEFLTIIELADEVIQNSPVLKHKIILK